MISVTPLRALGALAASLLLGSVACGGHAPDAQAPPSVPPDTLAIAPPSSAVPASAPAPAPDADPAQQRWDELLEHAAAMPPSQRGAILVAGVDTCTAAGNAHYFDPCLRFATALRGDSAHAQAAGDAAARHGHRGLALKLFRTAAELDPGALCHHGPALTLVAEVRSGISEVALRTDGDAIHARCETITPRP